MYTSAKGGSDHVCEQNVSANVSAYVEKQNLNIFAL